MKLAVIQGLCQGVGRGTASGVSTSAPAAPLPDVNPAGIWGSSPAPDGFRVSVPLDSASLTTGQLKLEDTSNPGVYITTGTLSLKTTGSVANAHISVSGLTANRTYNIAAVILNGVERTAYVTRTGFKTAPTANAATSFTFGASGCANIDGIVLREIATRSYPFVLFLGDRGYLDLTEGYTKPFTAAQFDTFNSTHLQWANAQYLYQSTLVVYRHSDHDSLGDDCDGSFSGGAVYLAHYDRNVPQTRPLAATAYYAFNWGRATFILPDERLASSAHAATDDAAKTRLGATQLAQLQTDMLAAKAAHRAIIVGFDTPIIATGIAGGNVDSWGGYSTERTAILQYIDDNNLGGSVIFLASDMHGVANGVLSTPGGVQIPVFQCGSWTQTSFTSKGGAYVAGPTLNDLQYGEFALTDTGADQISIVGKFWESTSVSARTQILSTVTVSRLVGAAADLGDIGTLSGKLVNYFDMENASNTLAGGTKVQTLANRGSATAVTPTQATGAQQPTYTAVDTNLNRRKTATGGTAGGTIGLGATIDIGLIAGGYVGIGLALTSIIFQPDGNSAHALNVTVPAMSGPQLLTIAYSGTSAVVRMNGVAVSGSPFTITDPGTKGIICMVFNAFAAHAANFTRLLSDTGVLNRGAMDRGANATLYSTATFNALASTATTAQLEMIEAIVAWRASMPSLLGASHTYRDKAPGVTDAAAV